MSIYDEARVAVLLADYVGIDGGGKANALGVGFTITSLAGALTAPQHVAVLIDVPAKHLGQDFALSLQLKNDTDDQIVQVASPSGQLEALRVQQVARAERPQIPNVYLPATMFGRVQIMIAFPTGIQLAPSKFYSWQVQIDGQTKPDWQASFYVVGPPPGAIFGGPAGPATIPGFTPPPDS